MENIKMLLQVKKPHLQSGSLIFFFQQILYKCRCLNFLELNFQLSLLLAFSGRVVCTLYYCWSNNY